MKMITPTNQTMNFRLRILAVLACCVIGAHAKWTSVKPDKEFIEFVKKQKREVPKICRDCHATNKKDHACDESQLTWRAPWGENPKYYEGFEDDGSGGVLYKMKFYGELNAGKPRTGFGKGILRPSRNSRIPYIVKGVVDIPFEIILTMGIGARTVTLKKYTADESRATYKGRVDCCLVRTTICKSTCEKKNCLVEHSRLMFANGDVYKGSFSNDLMTTGVYRYAHGDVYKGSFCSTGRKKGVHTYPNGDEYKGSFSENDDPYTGIALSADGRVMQLEKGKQVPVRNSSLEAQSSKNNCGRRLQELTGYSTISRLLREERRAAATTWPEFC